MTELERKIKAKIPGPDTGIEVRHTICDICSPGMHCGINAYIKDGKVIKIEGIDGRQGKVRRGERGVLLRLLQVVPPDAPPPGLRFRQPQLRL